MKGDLRDFRLHDLVQICCRHADDVRLDLRRGETAATLCFSGAAIVHAESPRGMGKAALFDLLGWESGAFELRKEPAPPVRTIDQPWASLLEEAEELFDVSREHLGRVASPVTGPAGERVAGPEPAGDVLSPTDEVVRRLQAIGGVEAALLAGGHGEVLASSGEGDPERLAAVTAYVGEAAASVGRPLSLGAFRRGIAVIGGHRVVVAPFGGEFLGLRVADEAGVDRVCIEARALLGWD